MPFRRGLAGGWGAAYSAAVQYWLQRFAFSFVIVGCVLVFEANRAYRAQGATPKVAAMTAAAIALLFMGARGIASRHRDK